MKMGDLSFQQQCETFAEINGSQSPLVSVQFEVQNYPRGWLGPFYHYVKTFRGVCFFPDSGCFLFTQVRIFLGRKTSSTSTPRGPARFLWNRLVLR
jgi:hypothetical protein